MTVEVPSGMRAGETLVIEFAEGQEVDVEIPDGLSSGDEFDVELDGVQVGAVEE